jgi:GR25 family glycosyltransferase involved in LPS biosynthesis
MKENDFIKKMLDNYSVKTLNIVNNGNILNNYTKKIYVINLEKNIIRKKYILTIMKKFGISFILVIVNKIKKNLYKNYCKYKKNISIGELGCGMSHLWCLNDIVKNKYKNAIIFEDDIIFHKNFEPKFFNIMEKQHYDFLLLGACDFHFSEINYKNITENMYRPNPNYNEVYGAHAIYYSLTGATYMLKNKLKNFAFFDYNLNKIFSHFNNTSFICYPNLVVTELTTSDNNHSYELFSEKEKYFYYKCFIDFNFKEYHFIYLNLLEEFCIDNKNSFFHNKKYKEKNMLKDRIDFDFFTLNVIKSILYLSHDNNKIITNLI